MPFGSSQWMYASGGFYNGVATQSLRFDDGSSAYLEKDFTGSSPDNDKKMTISVWAKRGDLSGVTQVIISNYNVVRFLGELSFLSDNKITFRPGGNGDGASNQYAVETTALFRDVGAWYHIVLEYDSTQATDTNRIKLYVNGTQQTLTARSGMTFPPLNYAHTFSYAGANNAIGYYPGGFNSNYVDGYLSEFNFIDGLTLDPTYFGETKNGVWIAKEYEGSYGTNGFRLQFDQTGTGTASTTTIGADTSGNTHHFTSSGIVASDCNMPDSPENNFCTMNSTDLNYNAELLEGNLHIKATTYSGGNYGHSICTFKIPESGKWYIEFLSKNLLGSGNTTAFGVMNRNVIRLPANKASPNYTVTTDEGFDGLQHQHFIGSEYVAIKVDGVNSGSTISMSTSGNTGSVSALAIDVDNGYLYVGATDGTGGTGSQIRWLDYADGSTGTSNVDPESGSSGTGGIARTFTNNDVISIEVTVNGGNTNKSQVYLNAGQDSSFAGTLTAQGNSDANGIGDFYYTVPTGYKALCTANLPEPTISPNADTQADDYFNTVLYDGSNSTNNVTGVGFQPDWVWIKRRNDSGSFHAIHDSSRPTYAYLRTNGTNAENTDSGSDWFRSFDSDGFTVVHTSTSSGTTGQWNQSGGTFVGWNWKANGGTTSTNDDGSIQSTVQASTEAGFSIVTYTSNNSAGATVGHGLGVAPQMVIIKKRSASERWFVWHTGDPTEYMYLNETFAGQANLDDRFGNNTTVTLPSNTVLTLGTNNDVNGTSGSTYLAYCFAEIEGYSKFGSYIAISGSGSTPNNDGVFVYTGFRPAWIMIKYTGSGSWNVHDNTRSPSNPMQNYLFPDTSGSEQTSEAIEFLSNGVKMRSASGLFDHPSGGNFIYMAFAEQPFKYANAR